MVSSKPKKSSEILDVTTGPTLKKSILFAIPIIISGVLQQAFNTADTIVVGRVSTEALGGVAATGSVTNLIINLFLGFSVGASVVISQALGADNEERAARCTHTSILLSVISGIIVAILGFFASEPALRLMGTPAENINYSIIYTKIFFLGAPFMMVTNFASAILRTTGDTKTPTLYLAIGGVVNVALNIIFVMVLKMNPAAGVAVGTVISNFISSILLIVKLTKADHCCKIVIKELRIYINELRRIVSIGLPAGVQTSLFSASNLLMQSSINSFGHTFVEGNGACISIELYCCFLYEGFVQAATTFAGQNFGAKKYDRIVKIYKECMFMGVGVFAFLSSVIIILLRRQLLGFFIVDSPEAIDVGSVRLMIVQGTYVIAAAMSITSAALKGIGKSFSSMLVVVFGICVFRIICILTVFPRFRSIYMLYSLYPISWAISTIVLVIMFAYCMNKLKKG